MTARSKGSAGVAAALADRLRGSLAPGATWKGDLEHDDVVLEVSVVVRRRVIATDAERWRADALLQLNAAPYRALKCECRLSSKGSGWQTCTAKPVAVVVLASWRPGEAVHFASICNRHRTSHTYSPEYVRGIVDLPEYELPRLRALGLRWRAFEEAERRTLEHRERRIGDSYDVTLAPAPSCGEESVGAVVERVAAAANPGDLHKLRDALPVFLPGWYVDAGGRRRVA